MTVSNPSISVVVPHLNQPSHLADCLRSLAQQSFDMGRVEIIVVDNGSTELPSRICAKYANVRLASESEPGPGPARNKGISLARAPLLAFIDADCIADSGWLETISRRLSSPGTMVIGGDVRIAVRDPGRMSAIEAYESIYAYRQKDYIERQNFSGTGNLAMRREVYEEVGPFAGIEVAEDRDWGQRATAMGKTLVYVPEMIVYHPARRSLSELQSKWDRHIAHDYEMVRQPAKFLVWLAKCAALPASAVLEIPRILMSRRVRGIPARLAAWAVVTRLRCYRAVAMARACFSAQAADPRRWNR